MMPGWFKQGREFIDPVAFMRQEVEVVEVKKK